MTLNCFIVNGRYFIPLKYFTQDKNKNKPLLDFIKINCCFHIPYMNRAHEFKTKIEKQYLLTSLVINGQNIKCISLPLFWKDFDWTTIPIEDRDIQGDSLDLDECEEADNIIENELGNIKDFVSKYKLPQLVDTRIKGDPILNLDRHLIKPSLTENQLNYDLFPNQQIIYDCIQSQMNKTQSATAVVQTGNGKTIIGLHCIKVKTLIICHMKSICDVWFTSANNFFNHSQTPLSHSERVKVGFYTRDMDISKYDIIISTFQRVLTQPCEVFNKSIGLLIIDEAHHIGANLLRKVIEKVNCKSLALTATPDRLDGKTNFVYWGVGPCCYYEVAKFDIPTTLHNIHITIPPGKVHKSVPKLTEHDMLNHLKNDITRNNFIASKVSSLEFVNKQILIFVERAEHAEILSALIAGSQTYIGANKPPTKSYVPKGKKRLKLDSESEHVDIVSSDIYIEQPFARIVIATYHAFGEGKNNPEFQVVLFASPRPRLIQPVGRAVRKSKLIVNKTVDVFLLIDHVFPSCERKFAKASKYFPKSFTNLTISQESWINTDLTYSLNYLKRETVQSIEQLPML